MSFFLYNNNEATIKGLCCLNLELALQGYIRRKTITKEQKMGKKGNNLELKSVFAISYGTIIDQSQFKKWQRQVIYSFIHHSPVVSPDCLETISRAVVKSHIWKCKNKTLSNTTPPWRTQDQPAKGHARVVSGKRADLSRARCYRLRDETS